jgi:hypothetical protein
MLRTSSGPFRSVPRESSTSWRSRSWSTRAGAKAGGSCAPCSATWLHHHHHPDRWPGTRAPLATPPRRDRTRPGVGRTQFGTVRSGDPWRIHRCSVAAGNRTGTESPADAAAWFPYPGPSARETARRREFVGTVGRTLMPASTHTPDERYAMLCAAFVSHPDVTQPSDTAGPRKSFGSAALRTHTRIFAMLVRGNLVVKLPAPRVDALIAAGAGERYEPGPGRRMKEWVSLEPASTDDTWLRLATEALDFVGSTSA